MIKYIIIFLLISFNLYSQINEVQNGQLIKAEDINSLIQKINELENKLNTSKKVCN